MEKKKTLGTITDEQTGREYNILSAYVCACDNGIKASVSRTDADTYVVTIKEAGEEATMMLSKAGLSALMASVTIFIANDMDDPEGFIELSHNDNTQFIYKNVDRMEDEQ